MTDGQGPTTTRRRLRAELRRMRLDRNLSVEHVTSAVEWSASKLVRIEGGQVGISVSDLNALLSVYGIDDPERVGQLRQLARYSRQRTWWSAYQRYLAPAYTEFIGAESDATKIRHYHPSLVPGLLQTAEYTDALVAHTALYEAPDDITNARKEVRRLRQQNVLEREHPPEYTALLDEAALRRPVGGKQGMRDQFDHLLSMVDRKIITMFVIPFGAGPHPGLHGAFALMEYDDPADDDVVCLETAQGDIIVRDQPAVTDQYRRTAGRLIEIGVGGAEGIRFLRDLRREFE